MQGTAAELESATKTNNLEDAFLALTGKKIREEETDGLDRLRERRRAWRR
jgi:hypothetical protein